MFYFPHKKNFHLLLGNILYVLRSLFLICYFRGSYMELITFHSVFYTIFNLPSISTVLSFHRNDFRYIFHDLWIANDECIKITSGGQKLEWKWWKCDTEMWKRLPWCRKILSNRSDKCMFIAFYCQSWQKWAMVYDHHTYFPPSFYGIIALYF